MVEINTEGSPTDPRGFSAGATFCGIKTYGEAKLDLGILASDRPCNVAATFTRNRFASACVVVNRERVASGTAQAVVVNSGIANSSTGERGIADAERMAALAAASLGIDPALVLPCSTGVIGVYLPMDKIESGIAAITLDPSSGERFARATMTTDTRPKHASVRFGDYSIGGSVKGAGMIHPNMATMLAFLTTDATLDPAFLRSSFGQAVEQSFNRVSVDGDTSPSDTAILLANGAAGGDPIDASHPSAAAFEEALLALCTHLARELARDAEGATRVLEVAVTGAASPADAGEVARLVTNSYLVKSAIHGADPNWGRIVTVLGRSRAAYQEDAVSVRLCGHTVFTGSHPAEFDAVAISYAMQGDTVTVEIDLGAGDCTAVAWGCDLSPEYVHINADYTT